MKKIVLSSIISIGLLSNLYAYELDGNLDVKWTGFKTEKKLPVSGTFNSINLDIKSSKELSTFLKSAKVLIKTNSFESKNKERNINIISTLFSLASSKLIKGTIINVNEEEKLLNLELTMNEVKKIIPMKYELKKGEILAKGSLDVLDFDMKKPYLAFAKKCANLHENKSYSNVDIEFTLPYK